MTLAERNAVIRSTIETALGDEAVLVTVTWDKPWLVVGTTDDPTFGFGFEESVDDASPAEKAARLIEYLANDLPLSRPFWGRPVPECPLPGHLHALDTRVDGDSTVHLVCGLADQVVRTLRLPA